MEYIPVKLPEDLIADVDKLVGTHGFRSRAEFVKEAIRCRITEIKQNCQNHPQKEVD